MKKILLSLSLLLIASPVGAAYYVNDPTDCPNLDPTTYPGQDCTPQNICGVVSGIVQCYNNATLNPPTGAGTSNTLYSGSYGGGYLMDCYRATTCNAGYCNRSDTCYTTKKRDTTCTANTWETATCGNCRSGFLDCAGDDACEVQVGVTAWTQPHSVYSTCSTATCSSGFQACNGDTATTNGCNYQTGVTTCTTGGGEPGTIGASCSCVALPQENFITNTLASAWGSFLLWGEQLNPTGWLVNLYNSVTGGYFRVDQNGNASTTGSMTANSFCINTSSPDCITAWPTGGSSTPINFFASGTGLSVATNTTSTTYSWTNPGYISAETDPIWNSVSSSYLTTTTASLTYQPIGNYVTGTPWQDEGYLTAETDPIWTATSSNYLTKTEASSTYFKIADWLLQTTDNLTEGLTNLYFTLARAREAISSAITGITYSTTTGEFSLTSGYEIPLTASTTNWQTAYSWGDHSIVGYLLASTASSTYATIASLADYVSSTTPFGGDVTGTYTNLQINDNSHNHNSTTISNLVVADFASPNISQWTNDAGYITTETDPIWTSASTSYFKLSDWYSTTTDGLDEGSTNLYYTDARVQGVLNSGGYITSTPPEIDPVWSLASTSVCYLSANNNFTGENTFATTTISTLNAGLGSKIGLNTSTISFDEFDFYSGNLILPRISFYNGNEIGIATNIGAIEKGFIVSDTLEGEPVVIWGGSSSEEPFAAISYSTSTKYLVINPDSSAVNQSLVYVSNQEISSSFFPTITAIDDDDTTQLMVQDGLIINDDGSPSITFYNRNTSALNIVAMNDSGRLVSYGGYFSYGTTTANGLKEAYQASGSFVGQSTQGKKTCFMAYDKVNGVVTDYPLGGVCGINNEVGSSWKGGLTFETFTSASPTTPFTALAIGSTSTVSYLPVIVNGTTTATCFTTDGTNCIGGVNYWNDDATNLTPIEARGINIQDGEAYWYNSIRMAYASTTNYNFFVGGSGNLTMTGGHNLGFGSAVLDSNTEGSFNIGIGSNVLAANTTGTLNIGIGAFALDENTTGGANVGIGFSALGKNTTGGNNIAIGSSAMLENTTGVQNLSIGTLNLEKNTTGSFNVSLGVNSMQNNKTGGNNISIGVDSMLNASSSESNVSIGSGALYSQTTGGNSVAIGYRSLYNANFQSFGIPSQENLALGYKAGYNNIGSRNTFIGNQADVLVNASTSHDSIAIGAGITFGASYATAIGGQGNVVNGVGSGLFGGQNNNNSGLYSNIFGGSELTINSTARYSTLVGGTNNTTGGERTVISGGQYNYIENGATDSIISGGIGNYISASSSFALSIGSLFSHVDGMGAGSYGSLYSTSTGRGAVTFSGQNNEIVGEGTLSFGGAYSYYEGYGSVAIANVGSVIIGDGSMIENSWFSAIYGNGSFINSATSSSITGDHSFIQGGDSNTIVGNGSFLFNGYNNTIQTDNSFLFSLSTTTSSTMTQSNTMSIMGGTVGISTTTPDVELVIDNGTKTIEDNFYTNYSKYGYEFSSEVFENPLLSSIYGYASVTVASDTEPLTNVGVLGHGEAENSLGVAGINIGGGTAGGFINISSTSPALLVANYDEDGYGLAVLAGDTLFFGDVQLETITSCSQLGTDENGYITCQDLASMGSVEDTADKVLEKIKAMSFWEKIILLFF